MADLTSLTSAVEAGDRHTATRLTQGAIDARLGPQEILASGMGA